MKHTIDTWGVGTCAILVLDCAGSHTSRAACAILEEYPRLIPLFVPPKMTGKLQPLDVAFFAPFKKLLRRSVGRFMLECGKTLGSLAPHDKPTYRKQCLAKKNISNILIKKWIPTCLKGLSPRFVRTGFTDVCKSVFPELGNLEHGLHYLHLGLKLDTRSWELTLKKACEWPNFNETAKLKDALHGFSFDHYSVAFLQNLCRERGIEFDGSPRKHVLVELLQSYEKQIDNDTEFRTPAEFEHGDETNLPEDTTDEIITYTEEDCEDDDAEADQEPEIEPVTPANVDALYEIERFVKVIDGENAIEVKWANWSSKHNTEEPIEKLFHDLGKRQFDAFFGAIEEQHKERPKKRRR